MSINQNVAFIIKLFKLHSRLLKRVDSQLSVHGISFTEFMVLYHLNYSPNSIMRRIELAESIGLSASGVTRLLLPMEKIGLVNKEANPRDARVSLVKLTKAGKNLFSNCENSLNQGAETIIGSLSEKQRDKFQVLSDMLL